MKTTQEQAAELMMKCGKRCGCALALLASQDIHLTTAAEYVQAALDELPILELLEVARAAKEREEDLLSYPMGSMGYLNSLKKFEHALHNLAQKGIEA